MTHKVYVVTDLGPGDGGKGSVVHSLCTTQKVHTIIKRGGAQGSHGVRTSGGESFDFSQWGCGTTLGIPTHLSNQMIVAPEGLLNEATAIRYQLGIYNPFSMLTVDARAICATPLHGIASRLKELARRENPRGTVGTGAGEAYRMSKRLPELTLTAGDLQRSDLRDRLAAIRSQLQNELGPVVDGGFMDADQAEASHEIELLSDDGFLEYVVQRFREAADLMTVVGEEYLGDAVLARPGIVIVESSHGVLTDRLAGFSPHTSAIRTLPRFAHDVLERAGYTDQIVTIGVTRAYASRHGAGPMPTYSPGLTARLLPRSGEDDNRYQGSVRAGAMDFVLLRYAVDVCGGAQALDGLAVTCFDQVQTTGSWRLCTSYRYADPAFFTSYGRIRVDHGTDAAHLTYQAALGRALRDCVPAQDEIGLDPSASRDTQYDLCAATIRAHLGISVRMVSFGPTELDKLYR